MQDYLQMFLTSIAVTALKLVEIDTMVFGFLGPIIIGVTAAAIVIFHRGATGSVFLTSLRATGYAVVIVAVLVVTVGLTLSLASPTGLFFTIFLIDDFPKSALIASALAILLSGFEIRRTTE